MERDRDEMTRDREGHGWQERAQGEGQTDRWNQTQVETECGQGQDRVTRAPVLWLPHGPAGLGPQCPPLYDLRPAPWPC